METIKNKEFEGERPLFESSDLNLENVVIHEGESALKECSNIHALHCRFEGKYPLWHVRGLKIEDCVFTEEARAALWYSRDMDMRNTLINAPKTLREMERLSLTSVEIPKAIETLWYCKGVRINNVKVREADYIFLQSSDIEIDNFYQEGKYSFQYVRNVVIRNSVLHTKDAFGESENVTIYDSEIHGEYLGWHSKNLRLVRCKISGTQPLCYAENLQLEDCEMSPDCDLAFEYSSVMADIKGTIRSIKNPLLGKITAEDIQEIILDEHVHAPATCIIQKREHI